MMPKPVQPGGPPILFGGLAPRAIERAARIGDGWIGMTAFKPGEASALVEEVRAALELVGRDPESFPLQATTPLTTDLAELTTTLQSFLEAGFTRLGLHLPSFDAADRIPVDEYLRQLETVWREVWPAAQG